MTTFQAIIYGILHGFTELLPLGAEAHRILLSYVTGWSEPTGPLLGALLLGSTLALLIYFIHDWASMVSSLLQIVIYRRKPMTLDERMPLFVTLATIPVATAWYYLHGVISTRLDSSIPVVALTMAGFGLLLGFSDSMSRKNKNMYDWNIIDALVVGVSQIASLIPGCGRGAAEMTGALFRNYSREAAAKFGFFAALPILGAGAIFHLKGMSFHDPAPMTDVSWLSFYVAMLVSFFSSLLAIGALMKHIQRGSMSHYVIWRILAAAGVGGLYFLRMRSGA